PCRGTGAKEKRCPHKIGKQGPDKDYRNYGRCTFFMCHADHMAARPITIFSFTPALWPDTLFAGLLIPFPEIPMLFRGHEANRRSFVKALSWRFTGSIDTFVISYIITGKFGMASSITLVEFVTKITIYYLHERMWAMIPWGKRP